MAKYVMALDQGTTSSRCILFEMTKWYFMKDSGAIHCLSFCKNSAEEFFKTRTKKRRLSRGEIISFSLLWSRVQRGASSLLVKMSAHIFTTVGQGSRAPLSGRG